MKTKSGRRGASTARKSSRIHSAIEPRLTPNALTVLERRYLWKDLEGKPRENPRQMLERVASAVAGVEPRERGRWAARFYELMASRRFLPNSPTLMNAGRPAGQLSACFVLPIEDSLDAIFDTLKRSALIHQSGGGTGFSFSRLRPTGSVVGTSHGIASGPVSFMRIFDVATETIKQGGTRRGANMAVLRVDHPDILDFIDAKRDKKSVMNFNISVGATREFMSAVLDDADFWLRDPKTGAGIRKVGATEIFERIARAAWECGDPGLVFLDRINFLNPTPKLGDMESTNPCVTGDTRVWVETEGWIPIRELIGKLPRVSTQHGREQDFRAVTQVIRTGVRPVFRLVTFEGYELRLTADHRVATDAGDVPAGELGPGDRIRLLEVVSTPNLSGRNAEAELRSGFRLGESAAAAEGPIPESVWRGTDAHVTGFLRGLFAASGSATSEAPGACTVRLRSDTEPLLRGAQKLLLRLGIKSVLRLDPHGLEVKLLPSGDASLNEYEPSSRHELWITRNSLDAFARRVGLPPGRGSDLLDSAIAATGDVPRPENFYATVKERVADGEEEVFDLSEPCTRHFHADGILVHNCGEQPLLAYESCNLGSLNVGEYWGKSGFDWRRFRDDIWVATRFLDDVVDLNSYPVRECAAITLRNRKIGLGVMGFADLLLLMGLPYDHPDAVVFGETLMAFLSREAKACSAKLARERGAFANWKGSLWDRLGYPKMRNATVSTVAPTGTISIIAGASSGIEPIFSGVYYRNVLGGERLVEVHPAVARAFEGRGVKLEGLDDRKIADVLGPVWRPAQDVPVEAHVRMQSVFQRHSDSAVSKTINLPESASIDDVARAYRIAYLGGCKGITVYRDRSRDAQVLQKPEAPDDEGMPMEMPVSAACSNC